MSFRRDPVTGLYLKPGDVRGLYSGVPGRGGPFYHGIQPGRPTRVSTGVSRPGSVATQGGGIIPDFWANWSTATGTSNAAIWDTDKAKPFTSTYTAAPEVRVTATDGLDFPTTDYLRLNDAANGVRFVPADGYITLPGNGESIYLRLYIRNTSTGASGDSHGIYYRSATSAWGPDVMGWYIANVSGGNLTLRLSGAAQGAPPPPVRRYWTSTVVPALVNGTTYRLEVKITVVSSTTYTMEARIYNIGGTLLDGAWEGAVDDNLGDPLSAETFTRQGSDFSSLQGMMVSLEEGQGGSGGYMAVAGLAISRIDWLGPYNAAIEG